MGNKSYTHMAAEYDPLNWNVYFECRVYKMFIPIEIINYYFPRRVLADSARTQEDKMNRLYFLSKDVGMITRTPFDDYIDHIPHLVPFDYILGELSREIDPAIRYNFVIADNYAIFIRMPHFRDRSSRLLCKHITISSRAPFARYAGEIWYNRNGHFVVNNSSGTYRPPDRLIKQVLTFFHHLSPYVHFDGVSFRNNT